MYGHVAAVTTTSSRGSVTMMTRGPLCCPRTYERENGEGQNKKKKKKHVHYYYYYYCCIFCIMKELCASRKGLKGRISKGRRGPPEIKVVVRPYALLYTKYGRALSGDPGATVPSALFAWTRRRPRNACPPIPHFFFSERNDRGQVSAAGGHDDDRTRAHVHRSRRPAARQSPLATAPGPVFSNHVNPFFYVFYFISGAN